MCNKRAFLWIERSSNDSHDTKYKTSTWVLLALLVVAFWFGPLPSMAIAKDQWYIDVPKGQWYYEYIRTLWEEDVTNGSWMNSKVGSGIVYYYEPDVDIKRSEWGLMLAKAFRIIPDENAGCNLSDVPKNYRIYRTVFPYAWLCAAAVRGIVEQPRMYPDKYILREQAVTSLIRGLGLGPFENSLSMQEANQILSGYRDDDKVASEYKRGMALAVHLGIVQGYTDNTLRPRNQLTRAETAALLYRSALYVLQAQPDVFTPDGDGVDDVTAISFQTLKNRNTYRWNLKIESSNGRVVASASGYGEPQQDFIWNGTDDRGRPAPDGTYYYYGTLRDVKGNEYQSARKPLILRRYQLTAQLFPEQVDPGGKVQITAWTDGWAEAVRAVVPGRSDPLNLNPSRTPPHKREENDWFAEFRVPEDLTPGLKIIPIIADYGSVNRTVELQLEVLARMTISATLVPNPSMPGGSVQLRVDTDPAASKVSAAWPWGSFALDQLDSQGKQWGDWQQIPANHPLGSWPVMIQAVDSAGVKHLHTIELILEQDPRANVYFRLSD